MNVLTHRPNIEKKKKKRNHKKTHQKDCNLYLFHWESLGKENTTKCVIFLNSVWSQLLVSGVLECNKMPDL